MKKRKITMLLKSVNKFIFRIWKKKQEKIPPIIVTTVGKTTILHNNNLDNFDNIISMERGNWDLIKSSFVNWHFRNYFAYLTYMYMQWTAFEWNRVLLKYYTYLCCLKLLKLSSVYLEYKKDFSNLTRRIKRQNWAFLT